jgi:hypothetical protein
MHQFGRYLSREIEPGPVCVRMWDALRQATHTRWKIKTPAVFLGRGCVELSAVPVAQGLADTVEPTLAHVARHITNCCSDTENNTRQFAYSAYLSKNKNPSHFWLGLGFRDIGKPVLEATDVSKAYR